MGTKRLFIAITLNSSIQEKLQKHIEPLRQQIKEVKWVRSEQAHFTLAFLGNVEKVKEDAVKKACAQTAQHHSFFKLQLGEPGVFPNERHPSVLWLGLRKGGESMGAIARTLQEQLEAVGFALEKRDFVPHLTIGRVRRPKSFKQWQAVKEKLLLEEAALDVHHIALIHSTLTLGGPVYKTVATFSFQPV